MAKSSSLRETGPIVETPTGPTVLPSVRQPFACPSCHQRYNLLEPGSYLCARDHIAKVLPNGQRRRLVVPRRLGPERLPWAIPDVVEEREAVREDLVTTRLYACRHPENQAYDDLTQHRYGAKHLTRVEVLTKYADYVLLPLGAQPATQGGQPVVEPPHIVIPFSSASMADRRRKRYIVVTALVVLVAVIVAAILRLSGLL